jgi:hypothetical protein
MTATPRTTSGPASAVPCAHCGAPGDYRGLEEQHLLDTGHTVICDACNRTSEIVGVQQVTLVRLRQA